MIGDSVWDVEAAQRCDMPTLAVCTGGVDRAEFRTAAATFATPRDLAGHLDEALNSAAQHHQEAVMTSESCDPR